jgi:hypothetical protein
MVMETKAYAAKNRKFNDKLKLKVGGAWPRLGL